jgi:hypothetical protein
MLWAGLGIMRPTNSYKCVVHTCTRHRSKDDTNGNKHGPNQARRGCGRRNDSVTGAS